MKTKIASTIGRHEQIIHRLIEEVLNKGNVYAADRLLAPKLSSSGASTRAVPTREAYKQAVLLSRKTYPDYCFTIDDMVAGGDTVLIRWSVAGTHQKLGGQRLPASERVWRTNGMTIYRFRKNLIVEWGVEADIPQLLREAGLRASFPMTIDPLPGTTIFTRGLGAAESQKDGGPPPPCRNVFSPPAKDAAVLPFTNVVNLYWGSYYKEGNAGYAMRYWIDDRASGVFSDPKFWAPLKEYSTATQTIIGGSWGGGWGSNAGLTKGNLSRDDIETELAREIDGFSAGAVTGTFPNLQYHPATTPNDLYVIWLPPNVTNSPNLDGAFGYHWFFTHNKAKVPYAVIGFLASWQGYQDSMFITETHEVYEAVTDPFVTGWRDANGNEIGDVCGRAALGTAAITEWGPVTGSTISVQREWSIKKCDCVDIAVYGAELTATPIVPGRGAGTPRQCGIPGKPPCRVAKLLSKGL